MPCNRIEHCSECPPLLMDRLTQCGTTVVTQPGFIYWRGDEYLRTVSSELLPYLYDSRAMTQSGIPVAFGSDAPVIDPSPWPGIYAAVTSRTKIGKVFPRRPKQGSQAEQLRSGMSFSEAIMAYTRGGAFAEGRGNRKGAIKGDMLADLALVDTDVEGLIPEEIKNTRSLLTIVAGQVKWSDGFVI